MSLITDPIFNPTGYLISKALEKIIGGVVNSDSSTSVSKLSDEAQKAEIKSRMLLVQAKVEQELAIAKRIGNAEEVIIEEYFDTSGKGEFGASVSEEKIFGGISGEGRKITKRVIKFTGYAPIIQENLDLDPSQKMGVKGDQEPASPNFVIK